MEIDCNNESELVQLVKKFEEYVLNFQKVNAALALDPAESLDLIKIKANLLELIDLTKGILIKKIDAVASPENLTRAVPGESQTSVTSSSSFPSTPAKSLTASTTSSTLSSIVKTESFKECNSGENPPSKIPVISSAPLQNKPEIPPKPSILPEPGPSTSAPAADKVEKSDDFTSFPPELLEELKAELSSAQMTLSQKDEKSTLKLIKLYSWRKQTTTRKNLSPDQLLPLQSLPSLASFLPESKPAIKRFLEQNELLNCHNEDEIDNLYDILKIAHVGKITLDDFLNGTLDKNEHRKLYNFLSKDRRRKNLMNVNEHREINGLEPLVIKRNLSERAREKWRLFTERKKRKFDNIQTHSNNF